MSWEQLKKESEGETARAVLKYLGLFEEELVEDTKSWPEHEEAVRKTEALSPTEISTVDKLRAVTTDIIDKLYNNELAVENGQELLAIVRAAKALDLLYPMED